MSMRDEYEAWWRREPAHGPPATRPLGPHHRQYEPCPVFERLCQAADARGLHVGFVASDQLYERDTPSQYRHIRAIILSSGSGARLRESVTAGWINVRLAAGRLLTSLGPA